MAGKSIEIEHPYSITAWALSVVEDVREDIVKRLSGVHRLAMEEVIKRLHLPPCPNPKVNLSETTETEIIDEFWDEFKKIQKKLPPFDQHARWTTKHVITGESHIWHEKYSLPYTKVLGYAACRVTSKLCGIGAAERSWAAVKTIKSLHRSHLGAVSMEKRNIFYITAQQQEARKKIELDTQHHRKALNMFGNDDINFDLQLEKWDVEGARGHAYLPCMGRTMRRVHQEKTGSSC